MMQKAFSRVLLLAIIATTTLVVRAQETATTSTEESQPQQYTIINKCDGDYTSYLVNMDDDDDEQKTTNDDYEVIPLNDSLAAMKPISITCDCDGSLVTCVGVRGCRKCCHLASIKLPYFDINV